MATQSVTIHRYKKVIFNNQPPPAPPPPAPPAPPVLATPQEALQGPHMRFENSNPKPEEPKKE